MGLPPGVCSLREGSLRRHTPLKWGRRRFSSVDASLQAVSPSLGRGETGGRWSWPRKRRTLLLNALRQWRNAHGNGGGQIEACNTASCGSTERGGKGKKVQRECHVASECQRIFRSGGTFTSVHAHEPTTNINKRLYVLLQGATATGPWRPHWRASQRHPRLCQRLHGIKLVARHAVVIRDPAGCRAEQQPAKSANRNTLPPKEEQPSQRAARLPA